MKNRVKMRNNIPRALHGQPTFGRLVLYFTPLFFFFGWIFFFPEKIKENLFERMIKFSMLSCLNCKCYYFVKRNFFKKGADLDPWGCSLRLKMGFRGMSLPERKKGLLWRKRAFGWSELIWAFMIQNPIVLGLMWTFPFPFFFIKINKNKFKKWKRR